MPRRNYSWEEAPRRRKRSIWRWLIGIPLVLGLLAGAVAVVLVLMVRAEFMELARQFDLDRLERMESASLIYDREGQLMGKIFIQNRDPMPYDRLPQSLVHAVVATEDQRFWQHDGVDYLGIVRAALANWSAGRIRQGASTVTQQLARNSFDLKERTYRRKLLEMALAIRIEEHFPKEKIMELYLNRIYFGGGLYGAESASRGYFGVPAKELTAAQAATLAGLLKSPNNLSPWANPEASRSNRDYVLRQMRELGFLTRQEFLDALAEPLEVRQRPDRAKQSYAMEYVRQQVIASLGFEQAMNGGFRIHTTLDSNLQKVAEDSLQRQLAQVERRPGYANQTYAQFAEKLAANPPRPGESNTIPPDYLQGAVLVLDNDNGGILVMVGGRDFTHSEYNRSVQGRRPVGTAFVPLVFAAAFENGVFPGDVVQDWALDNRLVGIGGVAGILGEWGVERPDNEYEGDITVRDALVHGKNAAAVRVGFRTGLENLRALAGRAGIESPLRPYANSYLGTSEMTLEETTLAYTMFPGGGERPARTHVIERIQDADGDVIYQREPAREKVVEDSTAWQVHSLLTDSMVRGTGSRAMADLGLAVAGAVGKTGTAYNFTDVWFVGYSSGVTCGVWMGFDRPRQIFRGAFGKDMALPVWVDVMNATRQEFPSAPMRAPLTVEEVQVCRHSGELATERCVERRRGPDGEELVESTVYTEFARLGRAPTVECSVHAGGVRSFVREYEEGEWPRAAAAVDLSRVRPVDVSSAHVMGGADPYNSISTGSMDIFGGDVPVAEAVAVEVASLPVGVVSAEGVVMPAEVRKAEPAGVSDAVTFDRPAMDLPPPPPIRF